MGGLDTILSTGKGFGRIVAVPHSSRLASSSWNLKDNTDEFTLVKDTSLGLHLHSHSFTIVSFIERQQCYIDIYSDLNHLPFELMPQFTCKLKFILYSQQEFASRIQSLKMMMITSIHRDQRDKVGHLLV